MLYQRFTFALARHRGILPMQPSLQFCGYKYLDNVCSIIQTQRHISNFIYSALIPN